MTAISNRRSALSSASFDSLPVGLIAQVAEAVTCPPDAQSRSVVIAGLTAEIFETLRWLHGSDPDQEELASLYLVLAEAHAHRSRMALRAGVPQCQ